MFLTISYHILVISGSYA